MNSDVIFHNADAFPMILNEQLAEEWKSRFQNIEVILHNTK